MTGFTDTEVANAVDRFLLKQVEVPELKTGARDILTLKDRVYDLITTALLLRPDSYFYVILLARNRLTALVSAQIAAIDTITTAGPSSTRPAKKISSTTDLAAAQAAILDLNAGLNSRSTGVRGSIGPAVDRFRRAVSSFVSSELTKNVVVGSDVVETGSELRNAISETWAEAVERHPEIVDLAQNVAGALSTLERVRLPESSVRDIVGRIQDRLEEVRALMESDAALAESRSAMLDLLTMRTLLTKASTFRNPELILMPKTRDTSLVTFIDSPGTEASVVGTISGPFNYDPGAVLSLSVNGGTPVAVTLPRTTVGSRAELRSRVFSPWVAPTIGDEAAITVDFGGTAVFVIAAAYASGPVAATALNAGLGPSIAVTWDAGTDQLVFQSVNEGDASHLRLLIDTADRQDFRAWAFPVADVAVIENKGQPVPIADIIAAVGGASSLLAADAGETVLANFVGTRTAVGGEEAILWDRRDSGSDLVSTGVTIVSSPSRDFQTLGIVPGMALHTTAPGIADYVITSVNGNELTLTPAPPAGTLTYYIGPDYRALPNGSRVRLTSGANRDNSGFYRVAVSGGRVASIVVDRNLQAADVLPVAVFRSLLTVRARGTTTSSGIGALAPSAGATALGIAVTASEVRPRLTRLQLNGAGDLIVRGVRSGDIVRLTSPSSALYSVLVDSVSTNSFTIQELTVVFETGNWTYEIRSFPAQQFASLQEDASAFLVTPYVTDFSSIDSLVGRLIRGARYAGEIVSGLAQYRSDLNDLLQALTSYSVSRERPIDEIVRTMREQGLDRALDLLLTLEIEELFSMDTDGVSYATWFLRKSAAVAREVVPVSKYARSDRVVQEWRTTSFQPDAWDPRGEDTQR